MLVSDVIGGTIWEKDEKNQLYILCPPATQNKHHFSQTEDCIHLLSVLLLLKFVDLTFSIHFPAGLSFFLNIGIIKSPRKINTRKGRNPKRINTNRGFFPSLTTVGRIIKMKKAVKRIKYANAAYKIPLTFFPYKSLIDCIKDLWSMINIPIK